ncbi:hypothetical protein [Pseudonocardia spinosispora]|uniref:hypothetical protein n=1 Tax=Pseudonocardia spinosispora TaxID=103441 RepID=UPI0012EB05B5|nr:hypothetical protein [Pseudonocardia spinosispora]
MAKDESWLRHAWTGIPNELIRNTEISWDAIGAFAWLASHQEMKFRFNAQTLADAGPRGRNHAHEVIRELERWGWLTRHRLRNPATGYTDIQVYRLYPRPVPVAERTFTPPRTPAPKTAPASAAPRQTAPPKTASCATSTAPRPGFVTNHPGTNPGPEPDTQNPRSEFVPDRPGTDQSLPDQSFTDHPGKLREKKTKEEEQGGTRGAEAHVPERPPAAPAPTPASPIDLTDPANSLCPEHRAALGDDPGAARPPCPRCGRVRRAAEAAHARHQQATTRQQSDEARQDADRARDCRWHDKAGWVLDPDGGVLQPAVRCDHRRAPEVVKAALTTPRGPACYASEQTRLRARQLAGLSTDRTAAVNRRPQRRGAIVAPTPACGPPARGSSERGGQHHRGEPDDAAAPCG